MSESKHTPGTVWIDDDGFIAIGTGDDYQTLADLDCNDLDIDEREANKDRFVQCWNEYDELVSDRNNAHVMALAHHKETERLKTLNRELAEALARSIDMINTLEDKYLDYVGADSGCLTGFNNIKDTLAKYNSTNH